MFKVAQIYIIIGKILPIISSITAASETTTNFRAAFITCYTMFSHYLTSIQNRITGFGLYIHWFLLEVKYQNEAIDQINVILLELQYLWPLYMIYKIYNFTIHLLLV